MNKIANSIMADMKFLFVGELENHDIGATQ